MEDEVHGEAQGGPSIALFYCEVVSALPQAGLEEKRKKENLRFVVLIDANLFDFHVTFS